MTNTIKPSVGRVVLFRSVQPNLTGGPDEVPAIVTRVWSDTCVNLMVMRDGWEATPIGVTSVCYDDEEQSRQALSWRWMQYQKDVASGVVPPAKHA